MTIGIICAIPEELTNLANALENRETRPLAHAEFQRGSLDGHDVVLVGAGIGKVNAALTTTLLAEHFGCESVLFSGVAGGLDPSLHIGDVVIADRVVQHDAGWIAQEKTHTYHAGHVPFFNPTDRLGYEVPAALLARAQTALERVTLQPLTAAAGGDGRAPTISFGTILTGDQFLNCEQTRIRLHTEWRAKAVEMEGGAVAQVAEAFGIPWLVVRALSDLAGAESHFDFGSFVHEVARSSALVSRSLLVAL